MTAVIAAVLLIPAVFIGIRGAKPPPAPAETSAALTDKIWDTDAYTETSESAPAAETTAAPPPDTDAAPAETDTQAAAAEPFVPAIDFAPLQKIYPDIYAWIEIPGTVISYPVVQHPDDDTFYIRRAPDKSPYIGGAIFTERYNAKDFTDRNTVIYGHYMKNGTLFTALHSFIDRDFFDEHRYVCIYTPDNTLQYEIFAVYPYDTRHLLLSFDYSDPYVFGKVFESVFKIRDMSAQIASGVTLDRENDRILTLSTCFYGDGNRRFLLQARLTETQP